MAFPADRRPRGDDEPHTRHPVSHAVSGSRSDLPLSVDALLERAVELSASDLHLTAGSHPAVRVHGHIELLDDFPRARPRLDAAADLPDHDDRAAEAARAQPAARLRVRRPRPRPLPRQRLLPARGARGRVPARSRRRSSRSRSSACPSSLHEFTTKPRGLVLVTGPTGSGKSTTLASLIDEINRDAHRPHHHDRGPDRVPAPAQALHRQPARDRRTTPPASPRRSAARCARTPT